MSNFKLPRLPETFATTRDHLHQLAFYAVSPARHKASGRMGLRYHAGGFGTPEFDGRSVRIEGDLIVADDGDSAASRSVSTIREAVEFLGHEYEEEWFSDFHDPPAPFDPDRPLQVDPVAAHTIAEWFGFAWIVLEELRGHCRDGDDVSEVQLWPEHFDAAIEMGDHEKGERASFGASPGDEAHPEPYLYVAAWSDIDRSNPYWNDESFNGASLAYVDLRASADPVQAGLDFLLEGYRILRGG